MKVYVVMESYPPGQDDDGNEAVELEAVHASREGAEGNLVPEISMPGYPRARYVVEMELLP